MNIFLDNFPEKSKGYDEVSVLDQSTFETQYPTET